MRQIEQIRQIRDEAMERLQSNYDYKILVSLSNLIADLEEVESEADVETGTITKLDVYTNGTEEYDEAGQDVEEEKQEDPEVRSESVNRAFNKIKKEFTPGRFEDSADYGKDEITEDSANDSYIN